MAFRFLSFFFSRCFCLFEALFDGAEGSYASPPGSKSASMSRGSSSCVKMSSMLMSSSQTGLPSASWAGGGV